MFIYLSRISIKIACKTRWHISNQMRLCNRSNFLLRFLIWFKNAHSRHHSVQISSGDVVISYTLALHHSLRSFRSSRCRHLDAWMRIQSCLLFNSICIGFYHAATNWLARHFIWLLIVRRYSFRLNFFHFLL
jgi:hypothetical protein